MTASRPPVAQITVAAPSRSSVFHKFASAGIWCLVGSFAVNFFSGPAREALRQGVREFYLVVTIATALLQILSVLSGVVALCGIRKYGKQQLLWKGLVGLLVPILLTLAAIPAYLKIKSVNEERARQHQQAP
jgi:hypothetical protein